MNLKKRRAVIPITNSANNSAFTDLKKSILCVVFKTEGSVAMDLNANCHCHNLSAGRWLSVLPLLALHLPAAAAHLLQQQNYLVQWRGVTRVCGAAGLQGLGPPTTVKKALVGKLIKILAWFKVAPETRIVIPAMAGMAGPELLQARKSKVIPNHLQDNQVFQVILTCPVQDHLIRISIHILSFSDLSGIVIFKDNLW